MEGRNRPRRISLFWLSEARGHGKGDTYHDLEWEDLRQDRGSRDVWATYFQNSSWVASAGNIHSWKFKPGMERLVAGSEVSNE